MGSPELSANDRSVFRPPLYEELRETRLQEKLATVLAGQIVSGALPPGHRFPAADEMVIEWGVSRTVVRESLHTLQLAGLISVQHGRRTEVTDKTDWDILSGVVQEAIRRGHAPAAELLKDLSDYRLVNEPYAAALMAQHGSDHAVEALLDLTRTMQQETTEVGGVLDPRGYRRFYYADWEFHQVIARESGNAVVAAMGRNLREIMGTLWAVSSVLEPHELIELSEQHAGIADLIKHRDGDGAAEAMRDHVRWASRMDLQRLAGAKPDELKSSTA